MLLLLIKLLLVLVFGLLHLFFTARLFHLTLRKVLIYIEDKLWTYEADIMNPCVAYVPILNLRLFLAKITGRLFKIEGQIMDQREGKKKGTQVISFAYLDRKTNMYNRKLFVLEEATKRQVGETIIFYLYKDVLIKEEKGKTSILKGIFSYCLWLLKFPTIIFLIWFHSWGMFFIIILSIPYYLNKSLYKMAYRVDKIR